MSWSEILDAGNFPSNLFRTSFQVPTIIETTTATATYQKGLSLFLEPSLKTEIYRIVYSVYISFLSDPVWRTWTKIQPTNLQVQNRDSFLNIHLCFSAFFFPNFRIILKKEPPQTRFSYIISFLKWSTFPYTIPKHITPIPSPSPTTPEIDSHRIQLEVPPTERFNFGSTLPAGAATPPMVHGSSGKKTTLETMRQSWDVWFLINSPKIRENLVIVCFVSLWTAGSFYFGDFGGDVSEPNSTQFPGVRLWIQWTKLRNWQHKIKEAAVGTPLHF